MRLIDMTTKNGTEPRISWEAQLWRLPVNPLGRGKYNRAIHLATRHEHSEADAMSAAADHLERWGARAEVLIVARTMHYSPSRQCWVAVDSQVTRRIKGGAA